MTEHGDKNDKYEGILGVRTQELDGWGSGVTENDLRQLPQSFSVFSSCDECGVIEKRFPITRPAVDLTTKQIRYFVDQEFNEAEVKLKQE